MSWHRHERETAFRPLIPKLSNALENTYHFHLVQLHQWSNMWDKRLFNWTVSEQISPQIEIRRKRPGVFQTWRPLFFYEPIHGVNGDSNGLAQLPTDNATHQRPPQVSHASQVRREWLAEHNHTAIWRWLTVDKHIDDAVVLVYFYFIAVLFKERSCKSSNNR